MAELMRKLGIRMSGGMHKHLSRRLEAMRISTTHWTGLSSNKGKFIPRLKPNDVLVKRDKSYKQNTRVLLRAILQSGVEYRCAKCGIIKWNDKFIRLHIEHKNGDALDNRIINLELLCPNCHSQTPTYGVIKRGCGGNGRRSGLKYGSLTEKLVSSLLLNSANAEIANAEPSPRREGVETRQEPPKTSVMVKA